MEQDKLVTTPVTENNQQNNKKGWKIATVVASILAICGIGFGVYSVIQGSQKDRQISDLKAQVENTKETEETKTSQATPQPSNSATITNSANLSPEELSHYIYVAQWNLKIALPSSLSSLNYSYSMMPGYTSLEVSGVSCAAPRECHYAPDFADQSKNRFSLGLISRYHKDAEIPVSVGEKILTIDDYNYYYSHPQAVYSTNPDEEAWETESVNLIQATLTNPDNYSAI